jgi:hypothetical protein
MEESEWVKLVGTGILALLNDYRGPPRQVIEMYKERIQEIMNDFE